MEKGTLFICIDGGNWQCRNTKINVEGPSTGEITELEQLSPDGALIFYDYKGYTPDGRRLSYTKCYFRELLRPMTVRLEELISEPLTS